MNLLAAWVVVVVVLMSAWSSQALLTCTEGICETVDCRDQLECECQGVFIKKGGICGCCDACYKAIEPGQPCRPLDLTNPPSALCKSGYFCNNGKCEPLMYG